MLPKGLLKEYAAALEILIRFLDISAIITAGISAYYYKTGGVVLSNNYIVALLVAGILTSFVFSFFKIYESVRGQSLWQYFSRLIQATCVLLLLLAGLAFITKTGESFSRSWFVIWTALSLALIIISRGSILLMLRLMRAQGLNERRVIIIQAQSDPQHS